MTTTREPRAATDDPLGKRMAEEARRQILAWHAPVARVAVGAVALGLLVSSRGDGFVIGWTGFCALAFALAGYTLRRRALPTHAAAGTLTYALPWMLTGGLILAGGSPLSAWWIPMLLASMLVTPVDAQQAWRVVVVLTATHLLLAVAFFLAGGVVDTLLPLLSWLTSMMGHVVATRQSRDAARARCERDQLREELSRIDVHHERERVARELHDGVGADLTALTLRLRGLPETQREVGDALAEEVQQSLNRLREVVWALRSSEGTLGELAKLLSARAGRVSPGAKVSCTVARDHRPRLITASAAHKLLTLADALAPYTYEAGEVSMQLAPRDGDVCATARLDLPRLNEVEPDVRAALNAWSRRAPAAVASTRREAAELVVDVVLPPT